MISCGLARWSGASPRRHAAPISATFPPAWFLQNDSLSALAEVRTPDLRRFLAYEQTNRPAPSSQARTVAALKCFFRFCVENEYLERDPAAVPRTPKKREALPDVLDRSELRRLLRVRRAKGGRQRAIPIHPAARRAVARLPRHAPAADRPRAVHRRPR
jgi:hypothetical protein